MPQYFKLRKKARRRRALRHQPDRLGHAQGRRAPALDRARRPAALRRSRTSTCSHARRRARSIEGKIPGVVVTRRAARRSPSATARSAGQGPGVLRRTRGQARRGRARPRLRRRLPRRPHAGRHLRRDPRPRRRRFAPATGASSLRGDPLSASTDEFYFFEPDPRPRLSSERGERRPTSNRATAKAPSCACRSSTASAGRSTAAAFAPEAPLFPAGRAFYRGVEKAHAGQASRTLRRAGGQGAAVPAAATAATARWPRSPTSVPSRSARRTSATGPCGGTRDGLCEVYDTECIWSQAYERLKAYGEEESMLDGPVVDQGQRARRGRARGRSYFTRPRPHRPARPGEARRDQQPGDRPGGDPPARSTELAGELRARAGGLSLYGPYKAKIQRPRSHRPAAERDRREADLTSPAITPTKAGEGKTTTSVSLTQGLGHIGTHAGALPARGLARARVRDQGRRGAAAATRRSCRWRT